MISFNSLGKQGRFGNQMFQYAALLGIARRKGYEFCIPPATSDDRWSSHQLFNAFDLPSLTCIGWQRTDRHATESSFTYDANLANNCPNHVDLFGHYQSEKYFKDIEDVIRIEYRFKADVQKWCRSIIERIPKPIVSLHVRRTDYINTGTHANCDDAYYNRALSIFPQDCKVIIFSDDIEWCKNESMFRGSRWIYSAQKSNILDMCLMSQCDHHIIANSSFSWWGAWLGANPDKTVVAPKRWFGPRNAHWDAKDIVPDGWLTF